DEIAELRNRQPDEKQSIWDTHPPMSTRIAAIMAATGSPPAVDGRPAGLLVSDLAHSGRSLQVMLLDPAAVVLPWDQFVAAAAAPDELQTNTDSVLRAISRTVNQRVPDVGAVLDHVAAGRLEDVAAPLFPQAPRSQLAQSFAEPLAELFQLAALRSGVARW